MPDYAINFLPEKLAELDFYQFVAQLIDWALLATVDDEFLEIPTEFIDLIGTYDSEEAVLAYYNSIVKPAIGTAWLMSTLLSVFESPYTVQEWFDYSGDSFKFKITSDGTVTDFTAAAKTKLLALIEEYKNERSILEGIVFELALTDNITDITMSDLSLSGNVLEYYQYDGTISYDGAETYGAHTTTPFS
jgi:hypothetical protein